MTQVLGHLDPLTMVVPLIGSQAPQLLSSRSREGPRGHCRPLGQPTPDLPPFFRAPLPQLPSVLAAWGMLRREAAPSCSLKASPWRHYTGRQPHKRSCEAPGSPGTPAKEEVATVFHFLSLLSRKKEEAICTGKQTPPCPWKEVGKPFHGGGPLSERRGSPGSGSYNTTFLEEKKGGKGEGGPKRNPWSSHFLPPRASSGSCEFNVSVH